ncbi:hypothetical protein MMC06_001235 [Schaereria dolodes]|nr:hypothetical protein [Schaereria dolodes]
MSASGPPSNDNKDEEQSRSLFHNEAKKHESHHYTRMYGGKLMNAVILGFGATLGADAANAAVGDAKEWWRH